MATKICFLYPIIFTDKISSQDRPLLFYLQNLLCNQANTQIERANPGSQTQ